MQLAQLNIGRILGPVDSPVMAEFVGNLDRINALAEGSPGFVWRLKDEGSGASDTGDATSIKLYDDELSIPNLSVWESVEALKHYVYKTDHVEFFKRRSEWFEKPSKAHFVMWWVKDDHRPTIDEALERLEHLQVHGPTDHAFTFTSVPSEARANR